MGEIGGEESEIHLKSLCVAIVLLSKFQDAVGAARIAENGARKLHVDARPARHTGGGLDFFQRFGEGAAVFFRHAVRHIYGLARRKAGVELKGAA